MTRMKRRVLPGLPLSLGYTLFYLSVLVVIPILACFSKAGSLTAAQFKTAVWTERTRAAYALTFGTSFAAAAVNLALGLLIAWVLVRYRFPGRRLMDALIAHARREGLKHLVLTVTDGNGPAKHLYESAGFRSFGIEPDAIRVDGRAYAKNHMHLELGPAAP